MTSSKPTPGISLLSSDPRFVTGGDALIAVMLPTEEDATVALLANGVDVTSALSRDPASGALRGLIGGLNIGENRLALLHGGVEVATLDLTNYPLGGPIFSGPHLEPWFLTTVQNGLGDPIDAQGNAPPRHDFFYMSRASGEFQPYDPADPPAKTDVAATTTDQGITTDYIVRRETGALNRSIYQIAVLFDPARDWSPFAPQSCWNHKVYIPLQGGIGKTYSQSTILTMFPQEAILNDMALRRGFMVAKTNFMQPPTNMDWVRGAESLLMLKERIAKSYGSIRYTFASGPSGGSMMQALIANSYPGLLDGIIPMAQFTDYWGGFSQEIHDCHLLNHYFTKTAPDLWSEPADRIAVTGYIDESSCNFFANMFTSAFGLMDPSRGSARVPPEFLPPAGTMYHPTDNPGGARGAIQDYQVNYLGRRPETDWTPQEHAAGFGFARCGYDNVGVQYGLQALHDGTITHEQFIDLNEKIGGVDIDYTPVAARTEQDPGVAPLLYRMGFLNDFQHLDEVAIISPRLPDVDPIATHTIVHSVIYRDRLQKAHGTTENNVLWVIPGFDAGQQHELSFIHMDRWLSAIEADPSDTPRATKIIRNKPADLVDGGWAPDAGTIDLGNQVRDLEALLKAFYPVSATPRMVAANGDRGVTFVTKAQLKPLDRVDYPVRFTDDQWARLEAIFSAGVCDWSKADGGEAPSIAWLSYERGPGGHPIAPPEATPKF